MLVNIVIYFYLSSALLNYRLTTTSGLETNDLILGSLYVVMSYFRVGAPVLKSSLSNMFSTAIQPYTYCDCAQTKPYEGGIFPRSNGRVNQLKDDKRADVIASFTK